MTAFRTHLDRLADHGDSVTVDERIHWDGEATTVAAEALTSSAPMIRYASTPGAVDLASGVFGAIDQFIKSELPSWHRLCSALGVRDCSYTDLLERLSSRDPERSTSPENRPEADTPLSAAAVDGDLYSLGLPSFSAGGPPRLTLGLLAAERDGQSTWAPLRGVVHSHDTLRLSVPKPFIDWYEPKTAVSVLLGVPAAALIAATQLWTQDRTKPAVPARAASLSDGELDLGTVDSIVVPASTEVRLDGQARTIGEGDGRPGEGELDPERPLDSWELLCETGSVEIAVDRIALREDPVVPFVPLGAPLADDVLLASLVEAAQLYRRVNGYWGVSPVNWVQLPVESRLGLCIVSSDVLYAGFEWQLANALFSFSRVFDKVLVLDDEADPENLSRAVDDMWVKAHPANDWIFGEPNAPRASAPRYHRSTETGSQLYIDATWDLSWDEEYIAPRVTYENSYPQNIRREIDAKWERFGLPDGEGE